MTRHIAYLLLTMCLYMHFYASWLSDICAGPKKLALCIHRYKYVIYFQPNMNLKFILKFSEETYHWWRVQEYISSWGQTLRGFSVFLQYPKEILMVILCSSFFFQGIRWWGGNLSPSGSMQLGTDCSAHDSCSILCYLDIYSSLTLLSNKARRSHFF